MLIVWFRSLWRRSFQMMLMQRCNVRFLLSFHGCSSGFLTGYRRVPILGMGQIKMEVLDKQVLSGSDDQHFPESLTCHSILTLPVYSTKEIMRDRLTEALKPKNGFLMWLWMNSCWTGTCFCAGKGRTWRQDENKIQTCTSLLWKGWSESSICHHSSSKSMKPL